MPVISDVYMVIFFGFGNHQIRLDQNTLKLFILQSSLSLSVAEEPGWLLTFTSVVNPFTHYLKT